MEGGLVDNFLVAVLFVLDPHPQHFAALGIAHRADGVGQILLADRLHDLRHTCASLAIAAGADIKVLQRMLGHASAALTLDRYGHLYDDAGDDLADRLDALLGHSPDADVRPLPTPDERTGP